MTIVILNKNHNKLKDMKNIKLMLTAFAAVLLMSATVFAQAPKKGVERGDRMMEMMAEQLDLSETQVEKITVIQQEFKKKMRALRTESNGDREAMRETMNKMVAEQETTIKGLLNEEQLEKWEVMRKERSVQRPGQSKVQRPKLQNSKDLVRPKSKASMKDTAVKRPRKPRAASKANKLQKELGLSDEQAIRLKEVNSTYRAKMKELKAKGAKKRKVKSATRKQKAAVKKILTPEQFEKWNTMVINKRGKRGMLK